jgi:predicted deacylase
VTDGPSRIISALRGADPGPTLIVVGGLHGNEPEGIAAARAAFASLSPGAVRGEVVALVGNLRAVALGRRHVGRDLNRMWTADQLAAARVAVQRDAAKARSAPSPSRAPSSESWTEPWSKSWSESSSESWSKSSSASWSEPSSGSSSEPASSEPASSEPLDVPEQHELVELADAIEGVIARARGPVYVIDLHTTSAPGFPFAVVGPTPAHGRFAEAFPLPGIAGLEALLPGVLTRYLGERGCITLAIEGGQHATTAATDNLAAVLTIALGAAGIVSAMPGADAARAHLTRVRGELPAMIDVIERHPVRPEHGFRMEPGFANIQRVAAGTLLARDATGEIRAPFDGVLLLPLYQPDGSDGFFFGRDASGDRRVDPSPARSSPP